jgi:hypothetical protein
MGTLTATSFALVATPNRPVIIFGFGLMGMMLAVTGAIALISSFLPREE